MSEAALTASSLQRAPLGRAGVRRSRLSALEALERGFALFRSTFAREAWRYYIGAAPLVVFFISMWVINGQIRISGGTLLGEAVLLGGMYLLRVCMTSSYMRCVRERAFGTPISKGAGTFAQAAMLGRLLAWKIILSAGALGTLPVGAGSSWFYSACQFASLEAQDDDERHSLKGCLALANQWFAGGLLLFFMLVPLWGAVWLNGFIVALVVPQLFHSMFGLNTLLSTEMGAYALIQSSAFWMSLLAGAWLALDPIVKCTFVVVCQHLRSRQEGDDLRGLLASLPRERQNMAQMIASKTAANRRMTGALFLLAATILTVSVPATARATQASAIGSTTQAMGRSREVRIQELRQALDHESQRAIYQWHDAEHPSPPTWFDKLLAKMGHGLERAWNAFWNFVRKLWPRGLNLSPGSEHRGSWQLKDLRLWLTLVAVVTLVTGAVLFWLRRRRETSSISIQMEIAPLPDMSDSAVASERSEDEWFALAARFEGEGELRLALRAAYLGLLAGLARREWLTIRRDRTNREYLNEFTRRWRRRAQAAVEVRAEIPETLRGSLRQFDRVWYGSHEVTAEGAITYRQKQQEFLSHV